MPTAGWYTVHVDSPPQGTVGETLGTITSGGLHVDPQYDPDGDGTAQVFADSASDAIRTAITGGVVVNLSAVNRPTTEYTFGADTSSLVVADHKSFLLARSVASPPTVPPLTSPPPSPGGPPTPTGQTNTVTTSEGGGTTPPPQTPNTTTTTVTPTDPDLGGWQVKLEDLSAYPDDADWDYNDFLWNLTIGSYTPPPAPATDVYTGSFVWGDETGSVTVGLTVTQDAPGFPGLFRWNYHVTNDSWSAANGFDRFVLQVPESGSVENIAGPLGWSGAVGSTPGDEYAIRWQASGSVGIQLGQSADFSFTTPITGIGDATGAVSRNGGEDPKGGGAKGPELQIKSVTLKPEGMGDLEKNPTDGDGLRIFPEKAKPGAQETIQDKVRVVVELSQAPKANTTVSMYQFDVDDPSASLSLVDGEWLKLDNRGDKEGMIGGFTVTVAAGQTTGNALRTVSAQPGDNYRFAASIDPAVQFDTNVAIRREDRYALTAAIPVPSQYVTTGAPSFRYWNYCDDTRADVYHYNQGAIGNAVAAMNAKTVKSELLTVWRKLHVERDVMDKPPAGEFFAGAGQLHPQSTKEGYREGDDDVAPDGVGGKVKMPSIVLMQKNYRAAYIEVVDDLGALNTKAPTFVHNLDALADWVGVQNTQDVSPKDTAFWAIHLVGGYEGETAHDGDPKTESYTAGETINLISPTVFTETIRDEWVTNLKAFWNDKPNPLTEDGYVQRNALHESLHTFFFKHHTPQSHPYADEGPLLPFNNTYGSDADNRLTPGQLHVVRGRSRPGTTS